MLITRKDFYKLTLSLKQSNVKVTFYIEYELNQMNLNQDGEYYFKFKDMKNLQTNEPLTDQVLKSKIASKVVKDFYNNPTNYLGKTITELSLNL